MASEWCCWNWNPDVSDPKACALDKHISNMKVAVSHQESWWDAGCAVGGLEQVAPPGTWLDFLDSHFHCL